MKDTALYEHLPGVKTPWSVKTVDLSLRFFVKFTGNQPWPVADSS